MWSVFCFNELVLQQAAFIVVVLHLFWKIKSLLTLQPFLSLTCLQLELGAWWSNTQDCPHWVTAVYTLIRVSVSCSYTVLRKDVREMNTNCPPKADTGLKPGEFKVSLKETNLTEVLHNAHSDIWHLHTGLCFDTTHSKFCSETDKRKKSFALWNAEVESFCHCQVYFYLKSSPGFLYSAPIFLLQSSDSFIITVWKRLCMKPVLVFTSGWLTNVIFSLQKCKTSICQGG